MFYTWVVLCSMFFGCQPVSDTRGPYETEASCKARGLEMIMFLTKAFKGPDDVWKPTIVCTETKFGPAGLKEKEA